MKNFNKDMTYLIIKNIIIYNKLDILKIIVINNIINNSDIENSYVLNKCKRKSYINIACRYGNIKIIEYLIKEKKYNIDQNCVTNFCIYDHLECIKKYLFESHNILRFESRSNSNEATTHLINPTIRYELGTIRRKILHHLFKSDDYIDSKQLRTRLYFEWYLGDSMSSDFSIDNNIDTIINIGERFNKLLNKEK